MSDGGHCTGGTDRFCGCKATTTTAKVGDPVSGLHRMRRCRSMSRTEHEQGCMRCGDTVNHDRDSRLCDACDKHIQQTLLRKGEACDRCDGHGMVYPIGDIQRAMNGRDRVCSECGGSGRVAWSPDLDDVHPDLRAEVKARVE